MSEAEISHTGRDTQSEGAVQRVILSALDDREETLARALSASEVYGKKDQSLIEDPSEDIRTDLEDILTNDLDFEGAFYFNRTYTDAPSPALRLNNLGRIGFPLSENEAKRIAADSRQAPFGMGERTIVDREVRDTWEMPGSEVFFDNPNWNGFVGRITEEVCERLGVNVAASQPRVELYKLLLHETGSHFLAHQDSEKVDGMFATIIIILPSTFTGGTVHLSHAGQKAVVDENEDRFFNTTVLAWYTDVVHEIKPITSGYRLALSYNLIHTTKSLRPALTDTSEAIAKIQRALLSWRQNLSNGPSAPKKILYLLEHEYSAANRNGSGMKGKDAHVVAVFESICSEMGFRLGFALAMCHVAEAEGLWGFEERTMDITELVSLDGVLLKERLLREEGNTESNEAEFIPFDLRTKVENGRSDQVEEEGYRGDEAVTDCRWYRRMVLVLWPEELDEEVLDGKIYLRHAMKALANTTSVTPTALEMGFFQYGLRQKVNYFLQEDKLNVLRSLCTAACRWDELDLWTKATSTIFGYESVETLGKELYLEALLRFPPDYILPQISKVLENEQKNKGRLELVQFLESQLRAKNASTDWILDVRNTVIDSLRPLSEDDIAPLVEFCRNLGGVTLLEKRILPQLRSGHKPKLLANLSVAIFESIHSPGTSLIQSKDDGAIGTVLVKELLKMTIEFADLFEGRYTGERSRGELPESYRQNVRRWNRWHLKPELAVCLIQSCLQTGNEVLIDDIVTKLTTKDCDNMILGDESRAEFVLLPVVKQVQELVKDRKASAGVPSEIQRLYREAPPLMLAIEYLEDEEVSTILRAAADDSKPDVILQSIIPKLQSLPDSRRVFVRQLVALGRDIHPLEEPLRLAVTELVRQVIHDLQGTNWRPSQAIDLLDFCADNNNIDCCGEVLARIMESRSLIHSDTSWKYMVCVPKFSSWLAHHGKQPTWEGFPGFFTALIHHWAQRRLGASKPGDLTSKLLPLQHWRCDCEHCTEIRALITDADQEIITRYPEGAYQHIEENVFIFGNGLVRLTSSQRSWYGTDVVKDPSFARAQQWPKNQAIALSAIRAISTDESVLLEVFGERNYRAILGALDEPYINHPLSESSKSTEADIYPVPILRSGEK
ncbi:hypothetical protein FRB90_007521 [Tulasnella sp. 427]|nr:hypothetical protein FRB90_007521 [Tulasnella sp. 427]